MAFLYNVTAITENSVRIGSINLLIYSVTDTRDSDTDDTGILGDTIGDKYAARLQGVASGRPPYDTYNNVFVGTIDQGFIGKDTGGNSYAYSTAAYMAPGTILPLDRSGTYTLAPLCFAAGTQITTSRGRIAVERLRYGDLALTHAGKYRPISWLGSRTINLSRNASSAACYPVRIRTGAFGGGFPERDLFLSPGHPVLVGEGSDEVLVPIMCLINGTSIARVPVDTVTYWHVELDAHDLLLAEGLPAESYYDMGSRTWFAGETGMLLDPDFAPAGENGRCRPVVIDGPLVEAERRRLDTVFHGSLTSHCAWPAQDSWAVTEAAHR